jgi:hypothetical protein
MIFNLTFLMVRVLRRKGLKQFRDKFFLELLVSLLPPDGTKSNFEVLKRSWNLWKFYWPFHMGSGFRIISVRSVPCTIPSRWKH